MTITVGAVIREEQARAYLHLAQAHGGLTYWTSVDLSDLSRAWLTGKDEPKPSWKAGDPQPVTLEQVQVLGPEEQYKRFHVAVRPGAQGLSLKLTDASSERVRRDTERARNGGYIAWHRFDYDTQEAVIYRARVIGTLAEWAAQHPESA